MPIEMQGLAPLLQVFDMPTSIQFYRDVLGFEVTQRSKALSDNPDDVNWAMLRLNDAILMLNTAYEPESRPPTPDAARFAGHADTGLYFGCPDVDGAYRFLLGKGLDVREPAIAPYGMKQLHVTDPDRYRLCLQWPA